MQKLKLCMPRKGSQILKPRVPLADRTNIIANKEILTLDNKENKPQNKSVSSAREGIKVQKGRKENLSKGIEKVVSLINYFRFLYRILEKLKQVNENIVIHSVSAAL
jgi:hypothetical protein